ncbi:phosphotransferase family protein [Patescibacteria group bacterium]
MFGFIKTKKPHKLLLDQKYMVNFFNKRKKDIDKNIEKIIRVEIYPVKKRIEKDRFHLVVIYEVFYRIKNSEKIIQQKIVCSCAANHDRKKYYKVLKLVYKKVKNEKDFRVPNPLWYINNLQSMFYKGIKGGNLLNRLNHKKDIEKSVVQLANFLAVFHNIKNKRNLKIKEKEFSLKYLDPTNLLDKAPAEREKYKMKSLDIFKKIKKYENDIDNFKFRLSHGDMHLENVFFNDYWQRTYVIDFSEACLASPAYDLGSFLQQLSFQPRENINEKMFSELKKLFLDEYFFKANYDVREKKEITKLINLYQAWTALKSTIWYIGYEEDKFKTIERLINQAEYFLDKYEE